MHDPADNIAPSPSTAANSTLAPTQSVFTPVATVSLKLPPFWPTDPVVWFAQVEAQFVTRNITAQPTKYAYIISALPPDIAQEIRNILINPPTTNQYDTLKRELKSNVQQPPNKSAFTNYLVRRNLAIENHHKCYVKCVNFWVINN